MARKKSKVTTTPATQGAFYRLYPRHIEWLAMMALRQKSARGGKGRADASEVLRKVLDKAMAGHKAS